MSLGGTDPGRGRSERGTVCPTVCAAGKLSLLSGLDHLFCARRGLDWTVSLSPRAAAGHRVRSSLNHSLFVTKGQVLTEPVCGGDTSWFRMVTFSCRYGAGSRDRGGRGEVPLSSFTRTPGGSISTPCEVGTRLQPTAAHPGVATCQNHPEGVWGGGGTLSKQAAGLTNPESPGGGKGPRTGT